MMGEEKHETREVFMATLALTTPEERARFLDEVCRGKPELRQRVEALLRAHDQAGGFLEHTVRVAPAGDFLVEHAGVMIGRYKLLQEIGEGGFGQVFMAEQKEPVHRKVALKIIKAGMDTKEVIARFEAERQALALMDHPNIARVFDGGVTQAGRPYFVMELVRGIPITEYCDRNNLPMAGRLELFMQVCQAVQHAHQKAIIHRDLKPTNILVTIVDGKPVPKIIDFGVAKALGQKLTEKTLFTAFEQIVGTPAYMSPEQAALSGIDVDTRSDIYSLGVLLYELLTGVTPFDGETLRKAALDEVRRMIRETEPPKPSTRLRTLGDKLTDVAQHRQTEPSALPRLVHGDLDWIVMKALEKDRARRYETADALLADIQRHLDHQPVKASPPGTLYRANKFIRRHRMGVALATSVTVVLIAGLVVSLFGFTAARRERDRAEHMAQQESVQRERAEAGAEAARNEKELAAANLRRAEISLIQRHLDKGEVGPALALLEKQRPIVNMGDSRSLEWGILWRRAHQGHRFTLRGHEGPVSAVAFFPSGTLVASAGADGTVRLWGTVSGKQRAILARNQSPIICLAISPDTKTLAWGDDRGVLSVWDLPQGCLRAIVPAHVGQVRSVAFSPDSKLIATCAWDGTTKLWDAGAGAGIGPPLPDGNITPTSPSWVSAVAFSPDGQTVACGEFGSVALWDLKTRQVRMRLHRHRDWIANLAFTLDGKTLVSGGNDRVVKVWDVAAAREKVALEPDIRRPKCMALSPDGSAVAIGGAGGTIEVKYLASGQTKTYGHVGAVASVAFSPDGRTLASAGADGTVKLWDLTRPQNLPPLHGRQTLVWSVAYAPDGKLLASAGEPHPELWDVSSGRLLRTIPVGGCMGVAFAPDGNVLVGGRWLWDVKNEKRLPSLPSGGGLATIFTPDGQTLIEGKGQRKDEEGQIRIWDWQTRHRRAVLRGHSGWVVSLAVSPDGLTLASASGAGEVALWRIPAGRLIRTLQHGYASVAFSPDGKTLATGSKRGGIALWDADTGKLTKDMVGHISFLRQLAFASDGKTIVSCNVQGGVTLWNVEKGIERATLTRNRHSVNSIAISPDGRSFATGGREGTLEIWRTTSESEVRAQSAWFDGRLRLARELQANANALHLGLHPNEALGARLQAEGLYQQLAAEFPQRTDYRYSRLANQASLIALVADHDSLLTETNRWLRLADEAVELACRDTNGYSGLLRPLLLNRLELLQSVNRPSAAAMGKPSAGTPGTEALAVIRRVLGPEHPETLRLMGDLAKAQEAQGHLAEAEQLYREALAIRRKLLGNENLLLEPLLTALGQALWDQKKFAEAEEVFREKLAMRRKLSDAKDPALAGALAYLTSILLVQNNFTEAESLARECLAIRKEKLPDHWLAFNARSLLGGSLLGQKKYAEAKSLLLSGYEGMKQRETTIPPVGRPRLKETLQRLVQLYEATGRPTQAAGWKQKLAEFENVEAEKKSAEPAP